MLRYASVYFCLLLFLSCSDDEPTPGCFQDEGRRIIATINGIEGTVLDEDCGFLIDPDPRLNENPVGVLFPCNLDSTFRVDGSRVLFSGFIYESFETEDICADFFEITDIRSIP